MFKAVTTGKDQTGEPLDPTMPHWQLTEAEGQALLAELKALDKAPAPAAAKAPAKPAKAAPAKS